MVGLRVWSRRASAVRVFPLLLGLSLTSFTGESGWRYEWGWGLNVSSLMTTLVAPLLAGLVGFDRASQVEPTLARLGSGAVRGGRGLLALVVASWGSAVLAWLVTVGCAVVVIVRTGPPSGVVDWWSLVQVPVVLAAAGLFGLAVGTVLPNLAAGPVAAVVTYTATRALGAHTFGPWPILMVDMTPGTRLGLVTSPVVAGWAVVFHVALGMLCAAIALTCGRPRLWRVTAIATGSVVFVLAGVQAGAIRQGHQSVVATDEPQVCVGSDVQVCGPQSGQRLLGVAQVAVQEAIDRLAGSGIDWQRHYAYVWGPQRAPADKGEVSLESESLVDGRLTHDDVLYTLEVPRDCAAGYGGPGMRDVQDAQSVVMDWLDAVLTAPAPVPPAPVKVRAAYQVLRTCEPAAPQASAGR